MKYKISLFAFHGGGWIYQVSDKNGVCLFKEDLPLSNKETARSQAVRFIEKQKDFISHDDIVYETLDSPN
jgi:hypothetical protein